MNENFITNNIRKIQIVFLVLSFFLFAFGFRWQVLSTKKYKELAGQRTFSTYLQSLRGSIYASDGTTLAFSEPRYNVYYDLAELEFVEKFEIQTREEFVNVTSKFLKLEKDYLANLITTNKEKGILWYKIADKVSTSVKDQLLDEKNFEIPKKLRGLYFEYTSVRVYPEGALASHILGLTTEYKNKYKGLGGLEGFWNGDLNPTDGFVEKINDANENAIASQLIPLVEPKKGKSIYTSIDKKIQIIFEGVIKKFVEDYEAESGSLVLMDPKTGEIMAFANYPTYDANLRIADDPAVFTNSAITSPYEMGSIGKVITYSAAIELGYIRPETVILENGHEGCFEFSKELNKLCTWDKMPVPGPLTAERCLNLSDNICFYHIANKMKKSEFRDYLLKFGIGSTSGVDLSGESFWSFDGPKHEGDVAAYSYGHGYLVNTITAIDAISALANYGVRMKPTIVNKLVDEEENKEYKVQPTPINQVLKKETTEIVGESMFKTYLSNIPSYETYYQHLKNYKVGMKSGSALIADPETKRYSDKLNNLYVGYDLSPDRKFILISHVKKPNNGLSFYNARVIWLEAFNQIYQHLNLKKIGEY